MKPPPVMDMKPHACKLYDLDNRQVTTLELPPRLPSESPRRVIWNGRTFIEGDGTGFYGPDEFAEIAQ